MHAQMQIGNRSSDVDRAARIKINLSNQDSRSADNYIAAFHGECRSRSIQIDWF
ncbi:hypothetical protein PENANT_c027G02640 [Penicillium antarcticum]|uniref:Uncharacterized protein n=1 Tax=Penicillium antarcticum TaxID=416450 RepID=A0A1V6PXR6_9EURO|nr:hypothetical protein PENANT_c027G02640 [Penicillium antarcticum]